MVIQGNKCSFYGASILKGASILFALFKNNVIQYKVHNLIVPTVELWLKESRLVGEMLCFLTNHLFTSSPG